jgi:hypothetical protein
MAYKYRMLNVTGTTGAVTRTVNDTTALSVGTNPVLRVVTGTSTAYLIGYVDETYNSMGTKLPVAQVFKCTNVATTFTHLASLPNWVEVSRPFVSSFPTGTDKAYVVLANKLTSTGGAENKIANSVALVDISSITTPDISTPARLFPACVIDNYTMPINSVFSTLGGVTHDTNGSAGIVSGVAYKHSVQRPTYGSSSTKKVLMGHAEALEATVATQYRYVGTLLTPGDYQMSFTGSNIGAGYVAQFDNTQPFELGFLQAPSLAISGFGAGLTGTYNYVAVYEYLDHTGVIHRSRVSDPYSISLANQTADVRIICPAVTSKLGQMYVSVYRTTNGGTQYYRLFRKLITTTSYSSGNSQCQMAVTNDNVSDATLQTYPLLYRQPGTLGTALDRYHSLWCRSMIRHKDRIVYSRGSNVYFSSFAVDGEGAWFNPVFKFPVFGGTGDITALASMDGYLVVFKKDAVFIVEGDGPPENGGSGAEFSPPKKVHTQFGCIDHRTLIAVPDGLMYRSTRGIELLTRSLQPVYVGVGEKIQSTLATYPYNGGACYDSATGRAMWLVRTTDLPSGSGSTTSDGRILVYNTVDGAWTTYKYTNQITSGTTHTTATPIDICYSDTALGGGVFQSWYGDQSSLYSALFKENKSRGYDEDGTAATVFVPFKLTTGWVHGQSKDDRLRIDSLKVLGFRNSNFNLIVDYSYNFQRGTYTTVSTFQADSTNLTPVQLEIQPPKENMQSVKFRLQSATPTISGVATSVGTGRQLDITGITVRLGQKGGGSKLPVGQKG